MKIMATKWKAAVTKLSRKKENDTEIKNINAALELWAEGKRKGKTDGRGPEGNILELWKYPISWLQ